MPAVPSLKCTMLNWTAAGSSFFYFFFIILDFLTTFLFSDLPVLFMHLRTDGVFDTNLAVCLACGHTVSLYVCPGNNSNCNALTHGDMVSLDEGRFPALELNNRRLSVKNSFCRKNGVYTRLVNHLKPWISKVKMRSDPQMLIMP